MHGQQGGRMRDMILATHLDESGTRSTHDRSPISVMAVDLGAPTQWQRREADRTGGDERKT